MCALFCAAAVCPEGAATKQARATPWWAFIQRVWLTADTRRTTPASARPRSRRWRRARGPRSAWRRPPTLGPAGRVIRRARPRRCSACTRPGSSSVRRGGRIGVGAVGHRRGLKRALRLAFGAPGRNRGTTSELGGRQHPPHQVRFHQARREEVRPARLPRGRASASAPK